MSDVTFYRCAKCGNLVMVLENGAGAMECCGEPMKELKAGTTDGAREKHVPALTVEGTTLTAVIGEVEHPMLEEHSIRFIVAATDSGVSVKHLNPGEAPKATFAIAEGAHGIVYEFCNLHGLWKAEF